MPEIANVASSDIYKSAETPKGMSLADMLNISRSSLALQKEKELYEPSIAQAKAQLRLAETQATGAEQKMPIEVQAAKTSLNSQQLKNLTEHANTTIQAIQKLSTKPDLNTEDIVKEATELNRIQGGSPQALESVLQSLPKDATPTELKRWLARKQLQTLDSLSALEKQYPSPQFQNLGNVVVPVQTGNELLTGQPAGQQTGMASQYGLPPTTQVQLPSGATAPLGAIQPGTPIVSQQGPMFQAMADVATKDFTETQSQAKDVQSRIATFQKIKQLAPEAFTGVGGGRKEFLSGIAQAVGIPVYELEKTATDELAKNSAILQLAGGNTDAARQIAEMANPNKKLTKDAIINMSNQLIGIEKLKEAKLNYLTQFANDPAQYNQHLNMFNQVSDYRIFQDMTPAEVAKLKSSMSKQDQDEISRKIKFARQIGVIK